MKALSDILADPNGGSRMSRWTFTALVVLAGIFGAVAAIVRLVNGHPDWWMGVPLALLGLAEGMKLVRNRRRRDAR